MKKKHVVTLLVCLAVVALASMGWAFANDTGLGEDFYTTAKSLAEGPVGKTLGLGAIALTGFFLFKQQVLPAVGAAMGAIAIAKSPAIATSMGFIF